jgi:hypothetical protein
MDGVMRRGWRRFRRLPPWWQVAVWVLLLGVTVWAEVVTDGRCHDLLAVA